MSTKLLQRDQPRQDGGLTIQAVTAKPKLSSYTLGLVERNSSSTVFADLQDSEAGK